MTGVTPRPAGSARSGASSRPSRLAALLPGALLLATLLAGPAPAASTDAAPAPAPSGQGEPLTPEAFLGKVKGKHKLEVEKLFAPPDKMIDLHRNGDQVYGDGAEVTNLYASGKWIYRGEKAARVVHAATGRKASEIRLWYDPNDRVMEAEFDWRE